MFAPKKKADLTQKRTELKTRQTISAAARLIYEEKTKLFAKWALLALEHPEIDLILSELIKNDSYFSDLLTAEERLKKTNQEILALTKTKEPQEYAGTSFKLR